MVVFKINADTPQEREVKIVSDKGTWESGSYNLYTATSLDDIESDEPNDKAGADYLGELVLNKEKSLWEFKHADFSPGEEKEIAAFVMDYEAPDGVY